MKYFLRKLKALIPIGTPSERCIRRLRSIPIRPGEVAIDCGANVGLVTEILAEAGGQIYAFEPNPHAFEVLKENLNARSNVECIPKGVYFTEDELKLYLHEEAAYDQVKWSTGSSLLSEKKNVSDESYVKVELVDLAHFIKKLGKRIRVLKLDVEGVEYKVLRRMIELGVVENIDYLFVETHENQIPELIDEAKEVRALIREKGLKNIDLDWV